MPEVAPANSCAALPPKPAAISCVMLRRSSIHDLPVAALSAAAEGMPRLRCWAPVPPAAADELARCERGSARPARTAAGARRAFENHSGPLGLCFALTRVSSDDMGAAILLIALE